MQLIYASKTFLQLTHVTFKRVEDAALYLEMVKTWTDVVRVRLYQGNNEVLEDTTYWARIDDPDDTKVQKHERLVERMDVDRMRCDRTFVKEAPVNDSRPALKLTVNAQSSDLCMCGHLRIEHDGPQSIGHCHSPNCAARCARFRWRRG